MAKSKKSVMSDGNAITPAILGTFEGECADSNITNLNGLDITRPVWETVFSSDEYKKGIELGHYIGFLGHPEDPNCMDFEHACIVMTEGHIDDDGKIQGKFNLIDTPVGRIVKTFTDAGVKFGISVRGAGDIMDNSVDPDTFVFRGFDLVSFPAYPDSIPTFTEIAASTDLEKQKKYKAVCAAVNDNIDSLNSVESIEILQSQFAKQSDEYKNLQERKEEISGCDDEDEDIENCRLLGMTNLYLESVQANKKLLSENNDLKDRVKQSIEESNKLQRKLKSVQRIYSSKVVNLTSDMKRLKSSRDAIMSSVRSDKATIDKLNRDIQSLKRDNLKYKQKIDAASNDIKQKDSIISSLRTEINETVRDSSANEAKTSNLDAVNRRLKSEISACQELLAEYQDAYADLYANAVGVHLDNMKVTASTSVSDIRNMISDRAAIMASTYVNSDPVEIVDVDDVVDDGGLVTL